MKLSSPRTWLVVAAGVLVLAGVGIVYVIKNPSLPPGWTWHEGPHFRVALPPGDRRIDERIVEVRIELGVEVAVHTDEAQLEPGQTPEEALEEKVNFLIENIGSHRTTIRERCKVGGYPGLVYDFDPVEPGDPRHRSRKLTVMVNDMRFTLIANIAPGVFSEADADFVFRSFRPK